MRLLFCPFCRDVVNLIPVMKTCKCGKCSGMFKNGRVTVSKDANIMVIDNNSFFEAREKRPYMGYPGPSVKVNLATDDYETVSWNIDK